MSFWAGMKLWEKMLLVGRVANPIFAILLTGRTGFSSSYGGQHPKLLFSLSQFTNPALGSNAIPWDRKINVQQVADTAGEKG